MNMIHCLLSHSLSLPEFSRTSPPRFRTRGLTNGSKVSDRAADGGREERRKEGRRDQPRKQRAAVSLAQPLNHAQKTPLDLGCLDEIPVPTGNIEDMERGKFTQEKTSPQFCTESSK